jgi:hypothetical protein
MSSEVCRHELQHKYFSEVVPVFKYGPPRCEDLASGRLELQLHAS